MILPGVPSQGDNATPETRGFPGHHWKQTQIRKLPGFGKPETEIVGGRGSSRQLEKPRDLQHRDIEIWTAQSRNWQA